MLRGSAKSRRACCSIRTGCGSRPLSALLVLLLPLLASGNIAPPPIVEPLEPPSKLLAVEAHVARVCRPAATVRASVDFRVDRSGKVQGLAVRILEGPEGTRSCIEGAIMRFPFPELDAEEPFSGVLVLEPPGPEAPNRPNVAP